jgi:hypothetical protein
MTDPERPTPGFDTKPGIAASTSDAATGTAVSDQAVGGAHDDAVGSAGQEVPHRAVSPAEDARKTGRADVGEVSRRAEEPRRTHAGDPFEDVGDADVQADRTGYPERSGM